MFNASVRPSPFLCIRGGAFVNSSESIDVFGIFFFSEHCAVY